MSEWKDFTRMSFYKALEASTSFYQTLFFDIQRASRQPSIQKGEGRTNRHGKRHGEFGYQPQQKWDSNRGSAAYFIRDDENEWQREDSFRQTMADLSSDYKFKRHSNEEQLKVNKKVLGKLDDWKKYGTLWTGQGQRKFGRRYSLNIAFVFFYLFMFIRKHYASIAHKC